MTRRDSLKLLAAVPLMKIERLAENPECRVYGRGHPLVLAVQPISCEILFGKCRVYWPNVANGMAAIEQAYRECDLPVEVVTTEPELFRPLWEKHGGGMIRATALLMDEEGGLRGKHIEGPGIWGPVAGLPRVRRWESVHACRSMVMYCQEADYRRDLTPINGYDRIGCAI